MKDREYHREYSKRYYHSRRNEMIQKLGGSCAICGSTENLQFDHVDASMKSFNIAKMLNHSKNDVDFELSKCQLLCKSCHLEKSRIDIGNKLSGSNNPFYGKHGSEFPTSKTVIDLDTGREYESATDYANEFGLNPISVARVCRSERKSIHGHRVKYKD